MYVIYIYIYYTTTVPKVFVYIYIQGNDAFLSSTVDLNV